jgi:hypothetical protein
MVARPRGICRIIRRGLENDVRVTDGSMTFEVREALYRARNYEPPLENLPQCKMPNDPKPSA